MPNRKNKIIKLNENEKKQYVVYGNKMNDLRFALAPSENNILMYLVLTARLTSSDNVLIPIDELFALCGMSERHLSQTNTRAYINQMFNKLNKVCIYDTPNEHTIFVLFNEFTYDVEKRILIAKLTPKFAEIVMHPATEGAFTTLKISEYHSKKKPTQSDIINAILSA